MTKEFQMSNVKCRQAPLQYDRNEITAHSGFGIRHSFVIGYFVIRHSLTPGGWGRTQWAPRRCDFWGLAKPRPQPPDGSISKPIDRQQSFSNIFCNTSAKGSRTAFPGRRSIFHDKKTPGMVVYRVSTAWKGRPTGLFQMAEV